VPAGSRPSPSARWSPASLTPLTHSVSLSALRSFCSTPFAPCAGRLSGDMFRSSTRLSTGPPAALLMRAADAPIPLSAQAPGYPAAVTACAARLQTRFLARRLSLPLGGRPPVPAALRSALGTGSPMMSLEPEQPAAKAV
jgi:hypothetical protein